tara:strand:+ start:619 stop:1029 length:411 start_codon:yes stop_codon:yes gene_type:complete
MSGKTRKKTDKRKSLKKGRKRGGGNTFSSECEQKKRKIRDEIEEVKAALRPQFEHIESLRPRQESIKRLKNNTYKPSDLENIQYMQDKDIELDKGMSNRLKELYSRLQKILEECPDKKGGKKSIKKRKTKRRKPRN